MADEYINATGLATTRDWVKGKLEDKAELSVASISTAGGGTEVHATMSQGNDEVSFNYYKQGDNLPDYVNLSMNGDGFSLPTRSFVDSKVPFIANYGQTTYADVTAAIDADRSIVVNFSNNKNLICITYATYTAGQNVTMSGIYKYGSDVSLAEITLTPESAWSITHDNLQEELVSGTSIKTINNTSLLGPGNINVGGSDDIFMATVGVTTKAELLEAIDAKKAVFAKFRNDSINSAFPCKVYNGINGVLEVQAAVVGSVVDWDAETHVGRYNLTVFKVDENGWSQFMTSISSDIYASYVYGVTGDLSTLTTDNKTNLVSAINEVYEKSGEPFRVKNWATNALDVTIVPCTSDAGNTSLAKMVYAIDDVEGADYQIVGMIAYEVFDAASGGNRINCWPVCQFTGNRQKELSVRWMCGGTTNKVAKRINAWVLLKHR